MLIENVLRFADVVCSRDSPCCSRAKSWDITDAKGGKVCHLLSWYTETSSVHTRTAVNFVLENVNKK
jgi:hypothetical protein